MLTARVQLPLALFLLLTIAEALSSKSTYQWPDQETEKEITCQKCPPGTFVAKHCNSRRGTECQPCPEQHYTSHQNYVEKCRYCNTICDDTEQVKLECNATHNRVCECKPGYLRRSGSCVKKCTNFTDADEECDAAVIDFVVHQNLPPRSFRRLARFVYGKKPVTIPKIRSVLVYLKNNDPGHALLPQLLKVLEEANLPELESKLRTRFLEQDSNGIAETPASVPQLSLFPRDG